MFLFVKVASYKNKPNKKKKLFYLIQPYTFCKVVKINDSIAMNPGEDISQISDK